MANYSSKTKDEAALFVQMRKYLEDNQVAARRHPITNHLVELLKSHGQWDYERCGR